MSEIFKVRRLRASAKLPFRATEGSAGMDLYACIDSPVTLGASEKAVIPTGIAIELPSAELAAFVFARSGLAIKHGIGLLNGVGVIDSDYRGEICVGVVNQLAEPYTIAPDERIAQLVIMPVSLINPVEAQSLDDTARGEGGFGSTGKA